MAKPKSPLAKTGLAIGAIVVVIGGGALAVRLAGPSHPAPAEQSKPAMPAREAVPTLIEKLPLPPPPLDRGALIEAAALAADAFAAGAPAPQANTALVGRSFELRLPFGCGSPDPVATWTYNATRKTIKFTAVPELWGKTPWVRALAGDMAFEAAEGFWVSRPWTRSETCPPPPPESGTDPAASASAAPVTPIAPVAPVVPRETLGLAQFFAPGASRTRQRGKRPYEFTRKYDAEGAPPPHGYQLVLSGRLTGFAHDQPVRCWSESSQLRPRCLFAVELTRVAFEDRATGETLAEWRD